MTQTYLEWNVYFPVSLQLEWLEELVLVLNLQKVVVKQWH